MNRGRRRSEGGAFTFLAALLPPQQVVFSQDPPVPAGLSRLQQVSGSQEGEHVQSQLHTHTNTHINTHEHTQVKTLLSDYTLTSHLDTCVVFHRTSLGSREMKSLWNCGSITCIMCFTWLVSHLSISSSRANSLSGPLHV